MPKVKQNNLNIKRKTQEGEIIPLKYDEAFKIMFSKIEILTVLLSKILEVDYRKIEGRVELAPNTVPNRTIGEIKMERDLVVKLKDTPDKKIILEVNIKKKFYQSVIDRNLHYLNQIASNDMEEGKNYEDMQMCILINFNNFFVDQKNKMVFDSYLYRNKEGNVLTNMQEIININIDECYRLWYNNDYEGKFGEYEEDLLLLGAAMMTNKQVEFTECLEKVRMKPEIKKLMERMTEEMKDDEKLWGRLYIREEEDARIRQAIINEERMEARREGWEEGKQAGIKAGIQEGIKEGIKEGIEQKQKEMIFNMKEKGISLEMISEISKLSIDEVQNILNN